MLNVTIGLPAISQLQCRRGQARAAAVPVIESILQTFNAWVSATAALWCSPTQPHRS
mgnify:CR=1 FL=1